MTNDYKKIQLKAGKEDSLRRFHPWIFSGAVQSRDNLLVDGDVVRVYTNSNEFIAIGHYQQASIEVRVLSFDEKIIGPDFWTRSLSEALEFRQHINIDFSPDAIYRMVNGEGDNLPGLVIDVFGETAVMQCLSVGMHNSRHDICSSLLSLMNDSIKTVFYRPDTSLINISNLGAHNEYLHGEKGTDIYQENGLRFKIDWERGQKTGFFIDQRDNRALLGSYSRDKSVLDLFSYTGAFSMYALQAGSQLVHSVDSSSRAINLAVANVALNFPDNDTNRYKAFAEDAFKFLEQSVHGQYDIIVMDPPAFAKNRGTIRNALQGYKRLNALAFDRIAKGGIVFTFSSSQVINEESFRRCIFSAAAQSGRKVRILHQLSQAKDHPFNIYHPEGEYIEGLVLYVD